MDGHHTHGGGSSEGMVVIVGIIGIVLIVSLPVILAILQAIITILLIGIVVTLTGLATFAALRVRGAQRAGTLPWQQRGYGHTLPSPAQRQEITASTEGLQGHIILTPAEYEEIRRQRYSE